MFQGRTWESGLRYRPHLHGHEGFRKADQRGLIEDIDLATGVGPPGFRE